MRLIPEGKVFIPELPPEFVERPTLRAELDEVVDVGLVCAPAGYGKSLLLADWASASSAAETAWVNLDRDDNDPRRLWQAVRAAVARCPSARTSSLLGEPWEWPSGGQPEFLARLSAALVTLPQPLRLVLDDLHELTQGDALHGMRTFLRSRPSNVAVLLATRHDRPLGLHRLRLAGRLRQLRTDRLRFSRAEMEALLARTGLRLTPGQVEVLHQRTDGLPAGVRLAAMALVDAPDPDEFIAHFSGDERSVAAYLVGEVLENLPEDSVDLLRTTSVSDPLPARLAAELTGREDAGIALDVLERSTDIVTGRTRDMYRLQPLMRTFLVADLSRQGSRNLARLHGVAARWWAGEDRPVVALEHAADSEDPALLSQLLGRFAVPLLLSGDHRPLRSALAASPATTVESDPFLSTVSALVHREAGDPAAARIDARHVSDNWPVDPPVGLAVLRAAAGELGALPRVRSSGRDPGIADVRVEPELEALARVARGAARLREGRDVVAARDELGIALDLARTHGFDYLKLQCLALSGGAAGADGDLRAMREASDEAAVLASRHGWKDTAWAVGSTALLAYAALLRAEPGEAEELAAEGLALSSSAPQRLRFALSSVHGAAIVDGGGRALGLAELQRARAELGDGPASSTEVAAAAMLEFEAALRLGHHAAARTVQSRLVECSGDCAEVLVMRSWAESAAGHTNHARSTVRDVVTGRSTPLLPHTLVDAWLQEATLALRVDERDAARRALQEALALAEPLDLLRPFAEADSAVRDLLAQRFGGIAATSSFPRRALAAGRRRGERFAPVLTERELIVLSMLASLQSLDEIAADLNVSVNTVKTQACSVYSKLGVNSRRTAVLAAYEYGLMAATRSA